MRIKFFLHNIYIATILLIFYHHAISSNFNDIVDRFQEKLELSERTTAEEIIDAVGKITVEVQNNLSKIASHRIDFSIKQKIIEQTVNYYFESKYSTVQVTSLNSSIIRTYEVYIYLKHLARLSQDRYQYVELYFDEDFLRLGTIEKNYSSRYEREFEFDVSAYQIFKGGGGDDFYYTDVTLKVFNFIIFKKNEYWYLRLKSISAKDTYRLDEYIEDIRNRWK